MKSHKMKFLVVLVLLSNISFAQSERMIKSTREKLIFLNDSIQNYKLMKWDGDYGHSGFTSPKGTTNRFNQHWYNEPFVHYLNNQKNYNERGLVISEDWFDKKDIMIASYAYSYTEFDSLSRIKESGRLDDNYRITDLTYNSKNNQKSSLIYWSNDSQNFSLKLSGYDESGVKLIKESFYTEEGYDQSVFYSYDDKKLTITLKKHYPWIWATDSGEVFYTKPDSVGTYFTKEVRYINNKMQVDKILSFSEPEYNSKSFLNESKTYKYDDFQNLVEFKIAFSSKFEYVDQKKYDKKNRLVWHKEFDGKITEYVYDPKDNSIELKITNNNSITKVSLKCKYDKYGNWIEQTKAINGIERFVWKRQILYYD